MKWYYAIFLTGILSSVVATFKPRDSVVYAQSTPIKGYILSWIIFNTNPVKEFESNVIVVATFKQRYSLDCINSTWIKA